MLQLSETIPRREGDGDVAFSLPDLGKPGHVTACSAELSLEMQRAARNFPGIGNQIALAFVDQRIPVLSLLLESHGARPEKLCDLAVLFDRHPLEENISGTFLDPGVGLKGQLFFLACNGKTGIAAPDALANAVLHRLMTDRSRIGKEHFFLSCEKTGPVVFFPAPALSLRLYIKT